MEVDELEVFQMELKYCERCGALWLRRSGSDEVYCASCLPKMLDYPALRKSNGRRRLTVSRDVRNPEPEECVLLSMEGGNA